MLSFLNRLTNLQQRLIVGVAGAAGIVTGICLNEWTYFALFFIISFFSLREYHSLVNAAGIETNKVYGLLLGALFYIGAFLVATGRWPATFYRLYPVLIAGFFLVELFQKKNKPFESTAYGILGVVYTILPYALLHNVLFEEGIYNYKIILGILFLLWANDTGGYFGGRFLGKHKLFERISPKKTWEGSVSGALFSLLIAVCLYHFLSELSLVVWMGLSMVIVVFGSLGDLVESQFKRSLHIKDSGSSIPGHGGFLDRFDGLIVSLPFVVVYFELL
jgi:phosphatidate cytidylyltransferase